MRYILSLVLASMVYAQESCYTVQLTSSFNSQKNYNLLASQTFDSSCELMKIGKSITVRCGCYDTVKETKPLLKKLQKEYKKAYIASTYKHRFTNQEKTQEVIILDNSSNQLSELELLIVKRDNLSSEIKLDNEKNKRYKKREKALQNKTNDVDQQIEIYKQNIVDNEIIIDDISPSVTQAGLDSSIVSYQKDLAHANEMKASNSKYVDMIALNKDIELLNTKILSAQTSKNRLDLRNTLSQENLDFEQKIKEFSLTKDALKQEQKSALKKSEESETSTLLKTQDRDDLTQEINTYGKGQIGILPVTPLVSQPQEVVLKPVKVASVTPMKPKKIKKKKKKKKKKKSKNQKKSKFGKKRDSTAFYSRYLDKLESKKASRKYGYMYKFGAQISYDLAYVDEADKTYTASDWRRIRVYHRGSFFDEKLFYELEYSFTGDNKYKDMYLGYKDKIKTLDNLRYRVKAGNIKIPFSLETYTSSKNITFMERALTDAYADNRKLGIEVLLSKKLNKSRFNLFGAIYTNSMDERVNSELDKPGYAMRLTYAYKFNKNHLLSVGGAFMNRSINGEDISYKQGSESSHVENKYVSVRIKNVDTTMKKNIEALYINNEYSLQAEYTMLEVNAKKDNYNFSAYYLQGSYFIIGNGRRYKSSNSTIGKPKLNRDGALEVALRYSHIDLNDKDEVGGAQTDYTYALNWYYNNELKLMLNYIVAQPKETDDYDGRLQILQARVLFAF